jgi:FtsH-binding integral membrane protein
MNDSTNGHDREERTGQGTDDHDQMRPIWYFVGMALTVIGSLVVISGVINLISPPRQPTVLAHLHVNLWWGLIVTLAGIGMWLAARTRDRNA